MSDARPSLSTFANPPADCRPRMRWWWFGPDVERGELARELTAMRDAGIGGVEVAFVYPLSRVEHPFLSPAFLDDLRFAADTARELGMTFDLTIGSGWSFGGPHITDDTAARRVRWDVRDLGAHETEVLLAPTQHGDRFLGAYVGDGSLQEPPQEFDRLEPDQDSPASLTVPAGFGPRVLALAWSVTTGQQVKRAAAGAEGPVLDHYSAEATRDHLRAVADPMLDAVPAHLVGSVFCDSLEAYGADWTTDLPAEFERRNGHPLLTELWRLRFDSPGSGSFRAEYYETLGELYERNFLDVVREWAAGRGVPFRVQSYGAPPARLRSYRHADLAEGEGWGWLGIPQTRWASSAAHHDGTTIVSSETWTWVHSPSFRATPLDLKGEAHEHFLLGINQLVGHGWPYSAPDARGLGWFFYASGALDDRNAWWPAMPKLTTYLARLSWLLRQGEPVRDVLLYLPAGDVYPTLGMEQGGTLDLWRQSRDRIGAAIPAAIRHAGLDFDLVDDATLRELTPSASTTVVLPFVSSLPGDTAEVLRAVRHAGGTVIAVVEEGTDARGQVAGDAVTVASLADELLARSTPDLTLEPAAPTIGFVHRRLDEGDAYLIVNTGATAESFVARPRSLGADWQLWNPDDARVVGAGDASVRIDVTLAPYQAVVLVTGKAFAASTSASAGTETTPETDRANSIERDDLLGNAAIASGWTARFLDGGEADRASRSVELPHVWENERIGYAGRVEYTVELDTEELWLSGIPERVVLDFGTGEPEHGGDAGEQGIRGSSYRSVLRPPVAEIVEVEVNGDGLGVLFAPPYRVELTSALVTGTNTLRLVVANSTASAFGDAAVRSAVDELVRTSRTHYGRRFAMQDLETATVGLRSGLLEVPHLRWS